MDSAKFLMASQNSDGGWGYHAGSASSVEATAWALMALLSSPPNPESDDYARAGHWLRAAQRSDGSWPAYPAQTSGCWVTSVACQALHTLGGAQNAVERGLHWMLDAWPAEGTVWWRLRQALLPSGFASRSARQDSLLRGWSWTPGTASWVEPTAHALLLLRSLPAGMLPRRAAGRRELAERMLFDRFCPGGGWNSGNPMIYGVAGVPRIGPTAWALLALRDHADRPEIQTSLQWLANAHHGIRSAASLALSHRCLTAYNYPVPPLAPALDELYGRDEFFGSVLTLAWTAVALQAGATGASPVSKRGPDGRGAPRVAASTADR